MKLGWDGALVVGSAAAIALCVAARGANGLGIWIGAALFVDAAYLAWILWRRR